MIRTILVLLFIFLSDYTFANPHQKVRILLITGVGIDGPNHRYSDWSHAHYNDIIVSALRDVAEVTVTQDLAMLNDDTLKRFDMIMNNSLFKEPSADEFRAFYKFIESGKSYFAVHAGLVSFLNSPKYVEMMGGRFINHDDAKTFTVNTYDAWYGWERESERKKHPVTRGVDDFKTLDELYLAQFNTDDLEVIARAEFHPVMWTRAWGNGRIMCLTLGHGDYSQRNSGFQKLLRNGVVWLATAVQSSSN